MRWPMEFPERGCIRCGVTLAAIEAIGVEIIDFHDTHGHLESGAWAHADTEICKANLA